MATYNTYANGTSTVNTAVAAASFPVVTTVEQTFDATKRSLAAADVVEMISVPVGTRVTGLFVEVLEGEAGQTLNVGDGDDPDGYFAAIDVSTTGTRYSMELALTEGAPNTAAGYSAGKFYAAAADTIDIQVPATKAYTTLRIRVMATVVMMG